MSPLQALLGRRLANREAEGRKIGTLEAVAAMGLDGLGSASYGPEAMLTVLAVVGAAGLGAVGPITWVILLLLLVLTLSYWQTVAAYPNNGGCYTVAQANLGQNAGLLAAAALMVDYMLNVAVGVSAGVGALTSAVPSLHWATLPLCLAILLAITVVNLRGTKESGLVLAAPTYLFIGSLLLVLGWGLWAVWASGGQPRAVVPPPAAPPATGALTVWLVLRAFAAGCTAMTGVEAVSNGVGAFKAPAVRYAHRTLLTISFVLGLLLLGIALLARSYGVMAMDQSADGYQSVISQLVGAVWGRGIAYDVTIASVLAVLCLSANTSFVGFPRLCRSVAADGYLPKAFAVPGRRLVYTAGVLFLTVGAGALLAGFGGITDRLIPLFAVGAFLSFTLSQAGMAVHWRREGRGGADRTRLWVNGAGALATGAALAIILAAKFTEGAWLTVLVIPLAFVLLKLTRRYYRDLERQVLVGSRRALDLTDHAAPAVLIPLERWDRMAQRAVAVAARLLPDVVALHLTDLDGPDGDEQEDRLRGEWDRFVAGPARASGLPAPVLVIESSPYRSVLAPLLRQVAALRGRCPGRPILVVVSELVGGRWWEAALHTRRAQRLRMQILKDAGADVSVLAVPWQLDPPDVQSVMAEEEPAVPALAAGP